jgi:hypothetical protein
MFFWQNIMEPSMTHRATRCINLLLNLQNKDIKEKGQSRWRHQFMSAHKLVLHLSSQCALARMAKTLSFHNCIEGRRLLATKPDGPGYVSKNVLLL